MPYKSPQNKLDAQRRYYQTHKEYYRKLNQKYQPQGRIWKLIHGQKNHGVKSRLRRIEILTKLGGCCINCYETHPFKLVGHHPFKIENNPEFMICVCNKCHFKLFHKSTKKQLMCLVEGRKQRWRKK